MTRNWLELRQKVATAKKNRVRMALQISSYGVICQTTPQPEPPHFDKSPPS
jgi:hypothetical protein